MAGTNLTQLEQDLLRVPGVRSARVVGEEDVPSEIHIVTTSKRSPKQVVRDVQSLAAAGFQIPIDHRIVSVVQLDDPPTPPPPPKQPEAAAPPVTIRQEEPVSVPSASNGHHDGRLVLERVVLASKGDSGWVKVALRWPDGQTTEGAGSAGASREARARGAATALLQALAPVLEARQARVDVDHVMIQRVGSSDSVLVRAVFYDRGTVTPLVGTALVYDDVATASVRAILQATNRKLQLPA
jgi:hypothetical protein